MAVTATYAQNTYTLAVTVSPSGGGTVAKSPNQTTYHYGDVVTLTAVPTNGWSLTQWSGDATGIANMVTITIDGNKAVAATFSQTPYSLTVIVSPNTNAGTVTPSISPPYHYGDVVTLTESPNAGYTFSAWSGDGAGTGTTRTVTITGNMAVTATYTQNTYTLSVTVTPASGGTVAKSPNQTTYHYGDVVTLTESPNAGYTFSAWSGAGAGTGTTRTVTVTGNMAVSASFTQTTYTLSVTISPTGSGTVAKSPNQVTYHYGDVVTLTESPNAGYTFSTWSGAGAGTGTRRTVTVTGNMAVTATYTQNTYTLSVTVNPTFSGWSGDGTGTGATRSVTVTGNMAVTATYAQNTYTLAVTVSPSGGGLVTKSPNQATYHYGDVVTLTESPNTGYTFSGWNGDGSGTGSTRSVTVSGNMVVTATFTQVSNNLILDMEDDSDVSTGRQNTWDYASVTYYPDLVTVTRSSEQAHTGLDSMKLTVSSSTESGRRNEVLHTWNPETTTVMTTEAWIYIPSNFVAGDFNALVRPLYERYWGDASLGEPGYMSYNGATFGIFGSDGRSSRPTYGQPVLNLYMNHGDVENEHPLPASYDLYLSDMQQAYSGSLGKWDWIEPYKSHSELRWTVDNIKGHWIKVTCNVIRNLSNWDDGRIEWHVAFPMDGYIDHLLYMTSSGSDEYGWNPATPIRTIGISPLLMAKRQAESWGQAVFCSGVSNYNGIGNANNDIYFDDIILSGD
ncbi:MAG: InlB B-repeat-containing protein [Candidatus Bathyarchaeota archaeon]|nr:InlB B-repeat-containing protein [Candidatus Bathyarchaeota archaeon]